MAVDEKKPEAAAAEATEDANGDKFGDIELAGYLGASKSLTESVSAYGEVYGQTTTGDDNAYSGKVGLTFEF